MKLSYGLLIGLTACLHGAVVSSPAPHGPIAFLPAEGCASPVRHPMPPIRASDALSAVELRTNPLAARAFFARHLPGGYTEGPHPSAPGRPIVWMQDTSARAAVLAALAAKGNVLNMPAFSPDSVEVRITEWDAAGLYDWMEYLVGSNVLAVGVNGWSIQRRRVELDLIDQASVPRLLAYLESRHVPCDVVVFEVIGPITTL